MRFKLTCIRLILGFLIHPWQRQGNLFEQALYVVSRFSRSFHEHDVQLVDLGRRLFQGYLTGKNEMQTIDTVVESLPLVRQICLITH